MTRFDHNPRSRGGLRRSLRAPAILLGAVAIALTGACSVPPSRNDTIVTRRLELVDDAGVVRARLGIDADGSAGLFLLAPDGRNRAALIDDASQTALYIFDDDETVRIGVAQFAHGGGGVALHGEDGRGGAVLYLAGGAGSLAFYDEDGGTRFRIPERPASGD